MSAYQIKEIRYPLTGTGRIVSVIEAEGIKKALRRAETATGSPVHPYSIDRDSAEGYNGRGAIISVTRLGHA